MDETCGFDGGDREADVIASPPPGARPSCRGHLHRSLQRRFAGTIAVTAPSTASQLALGIDGGTDAYTNEPTGFLLHHWRAGIGLTSHVVPVGDFDLVVTQLGGLTRTLRRADLFRQRETSGDVGSSAVPCGRHPGYGDSARSWSAGAPVPELEEHMSAATTARGTESLSFEHIGMTFPDGTEAIRDVSFTIRKGEFVTVVGPSGCGKSTLLKIASGLLEPTAGRVVVDRDRLGYVFQDATLLPWRTVKGNVELLAELHDIPRCRPLATGRRCDPARRASTGSRTTIPSRCRAA